MQTLKKIVGKTVLVATAALSMTMVMGGTADKSASCPSGHYLCAYKSSWFSKSIKCCPNTHNCCPSEICLDILGREVKRISESCMVPGTPCPSC